MNQKPSLKDIYAVFTKCPVLLPLQPEKKISFESGWPDFTWETTQDPHYQWRLSRATNIGILSGKPSSNLLFFDWDTQAGLDWFLENNPQFKEGFAVTGRGFGGQVAGYCEGEYPANAVFHLPLDHPLAVGAKPPKEGDTVQVGSFRGDRLQSVLVGIHPDTKKSYTWLLDNPPITFRFEEVKWHPDLHLPWTEIPHGSSNETNGDGSFDWMTQTVTIDFLWKYFGFKPRGGKNRIPSPFRDDNDLEHLAFSITTDEKTGKQIFRDFHDNYLSHKGDSYKFYQLGTGLDSKAAYKPFETLAYAILNGEPIPPYQKEPLMEGPQGAETELYIPPVREIVKVAPIGEAAYQGFIGDWVRFVEPQTEANCDNVLLQFVVTLGVVMGRYFYTYSGQQLFTNLFTVILGPTGSRKGTALVPVKKFFSLAAPDWRGTPGSWKSGEALIHAIRDPKESANGRTIDSGVADKRLLVEETELIHLFKTAEWQGNTLTDTLRVAWDSPETMATRAVKNPFRATAPHIGLIGHMTHEEFLLVDPGLITNGLINRITWGNAFRARKLPNVQPILFPVSLLDRFKDIYAYAYRPPNEVDIKDMSAPPKSQELPLDANAQLLWEKVFAEPEETGTLADVCKRFLSQARKYAEIYTICDMARKITRPHLEAGLAIANHSKANAKVIFSGFGPNKIANKILAALRRNPGGLPLADINRRVFNSRVSSDEIHEALAILTHNKLATTKGKVFPSRSVIWHAI